MANRAPGTIHSVRRYTFDAPVETVWKGLSHVDRYSSWWPWLRRFTASGLVFGDVWKCVVQAPAPYRLSFHIALIGVKGPHDIAATVGGDVEGTARVSLREARGTVGANACELVIESRLVARRLALRLACRLFPSMAERSHGALLDIGIRQFAARGLGVPVTVGPHPATT